MVKHVEDASKKELPPDSFRGRFYSYSQGCFTKSVAALWRDQLADWYPSIANEDVNVP